jgi:hypothetical protein
VLPSLGQPPGFALSLNAKGSQRFLGPGWSALAPQSIYNTREEEHA